MSISGIIVCVMMLTCCRACLCVELVFDLVQVWSFSVSKNAACAPVYHRRRCLQAALFDGDILF